MLLNQGKRGIHKMANEFNTDEQSTTNKVEDNKYELNRNAPTVDAMTDEEYAAEVAPNVVDFNRRNNETQRGFNTNKDMNNGALSNSETNIDDVTSGRGIAGLALALSVLSLFVLPILLGAAGIIIGFIARRRGATTLGTWAIGIGAVSIIVGMFILPFF
jgi:hypothetical protein